jgi:hypothetical protein
MIVLSTVKKKLAERKSISRRTMKLKKQIFRKVRVFVIGSILGSLLCCPEEFNPTYSVSLSVEEISCQSISLHLSIPKTSDSQKFMIKRNGIEIIQGTIIEEDTLINDDSLEINTAYRYRAYVLSGCNLADSSEEITAMTMDTTSSDFIWDIDTIGVNISDFYDVSIIDENNIWAVGEIETDSYDTLIVNADTFLTPILYNAANWNGNEWELIRVQPEGYLFAKKTAIFSFSENDFWTGSTIAIHFNGTNFIPFGTDENYPGGFYVQSIWGNSSSDMYFVGDSGSIVHYDGTTFTLMDSGTDLLLRDVAGSGEHVFAIGRNYSGESGILSLEDGQWQMLYQADDLKIEYYTAVDVYGDIAYFVTKTGILRYNFKRKLLSLKKSGKLKIGCTIILK